MRGSKKLCQRGSNSTFFFWLIRAREDPNTKKAGVVFGSLAKRHFKWCFAGGPMMARHVMLAWYMCSFEIFYEIWTNIDKKTIFL